MEYLTSDIDLPIGSHTLIKSDDGTDIELVVCEDSKDLFEGCGDNNDDCYFYDLFANHPISVKCNYKCCYGQRKDKTNVHFKQVK